MDLNHRVSVQHTLQIRWIKLTDILKDVASSRCNYLFAFVVSIRPL